MTADDSFAGEFEKFAKDNCNVFEDTEENKLQSAFTTPTATTVSAHSTHSRHHTTLMTVECVVCRWHHWCCCVCRYTVLYNQFTALFNTRVESFISKSGATLDEFVDACQNVSPLSPSQRLVTPTAHMPLDSSPECC